MVSADLIERHTDAAREVERFFRIRLAEAERAEDKDRARQGLRNAVAVRKQMECWPRPQQPQRALPGSPATPREDRSPLTWRSTDQPTSS